VSCNYLGLLESLSPVELQCRAVRCRPSNGLQDMVAGWSSADELSNGKGCNHIDLLPSRFADYSIATTAILLV